MSRLMALSITTGIICGVWVHVAEPLGLLSWLGFAGCTTYFASGKHGAEGVFVTIRQNMFGVLCGMTIIFLSNQFQFTGNGLVFSGFITFVMCIAAKWKYLAFIPGTFVGSFSTFAANGEWQGVVIALLIGAFIGIACDKSGGWLHKITGSKEDVEPAENM